ncbi:unnamed protein product, partial [Choristocarpus tenellus]
MGEGGGGGGGGEGGGGFARSSGSGPLRRGISNASLPHSPRPLSQGSRLEERCLGLTKCFPSMGKAAGLLAERARSSRRDLLDAVDALREKVARAGGTQVSSE